MRDRDEEAIAEFLLEHQEQRFRLSYPLGRWQQEAPEQDVEELFADEDADTALLPADESVTAADLQKNNERLRGYVKSIRDIARAVEDQIAPEHRTYGDMKQSEQAAGLARSIQRGPVRQPGLHARLP